MMIQKKPKLAYSEKTMKINEISLSNIASFIAGAYTFLLINYFWFDNHITVPGVSTLIASMSLLFTIYAAFIVRNWSKQKINDKAFTQTDIIISSLSELLLLCTDIQSQMKLITLVTDTERASMALDKKNIINEKKTLIAQKMIDLNIVLFTLKMWKCSTTKDANDIIESISEEMELVQMNIMTFNVMIDKPVSEIHISGLANHLLRSIKQLNRVIPLYGKFVDLGYSKAFIHNEK
jgi:hypothetical protein